MVNYLLCFGVDLSTFCLIKTNLKKKKKKKLRIFIDYAQKSPQTLSVNLSCQWNQQDCSHQCHSNVINPPKMSNSVVFFCFFFSVKIISMDVESKRGAYTFLEVSCVHISFFHGQSSSISKSIKYMVGDPSRFDKLSMLTFKGRRGSMYNLLCIDRYTISTRPHKVFKLWVLY